MTKSTQPPYFGQCLCGEIKYQIDAIEPNMGHCHCSMCRKFHGAAFATFGEARTENFRWLKGEHLLKAYTAENGTMRQFCNSCGSSLTFAESAESNGLVEFAMGTLDGETAELPDAHIFVGSKASWYEIESDLPKYESDRKSKLV